ncbi:hypothetical protein ACFYKX_25500 [Cytobacillus sp. FJAT-54145]|uniref:Type II secretion system protein GspF domain-containing protein n=1 Tax=Cytobacillus spartinae TaxID=3299023 RepID=A0ABW6KI97_9BACI
MTISDSIFLFKILPALVKVFAVLGAIFAGYLVYSGLSSRIEKQHIRLRLKGALQEKNLQYRDKVAKGNVEILFKEAGNPLGINGIRWEIFKWALMILVSSNYIFIPYLMKGDFSSFYILIILGGMILLSPTFPYSLTRFILNRVIEYRKAKRNSELFSLYDMLISELQMMNSTRVNAYSLLRTLKPYFKELDGPLTRLLANWTKDEGPEIALELFADEIGTGEAKSLSNVLKKFDENTKDTILKSLKGMEEMFITSQIENYRRKRKLYVDLAGLPIRAAHGLILLNFVLVIIAMVAFILQDARL